MHYIHQDKNFIMRSVKPTSQKIQRLYLLLTLLSTLSASMIWGINTIFLLDAGLSNTQAFITNAFFTVGQVIFEVPTGMVADIRGRRASYLLGTITLSLSTLMYLGAWWIHAPLGIWAISSIFLGLGFTFFSGATEAWLVDSLEFAGFKGSLESVFARGQMVGGAAMLIGAVGGGFIAQATGLYVPYLLRAVLLILTFVVAFVGMHDWGFMPSRGKSLVKDIRVLFINSFELGWKTPTLRWLILAGPFVSGVGFYAFYAMQPYLLQLYGDESAYGVAGLAAAIVAGSQILGGVLVPQVSKRFRLRSSILILTGFLTAGLLVLLGFTTKFGVAIGLLSLWGLVSAIFLPVRQAFVNGLVPSKNRATLLSFDSLVGSSGGAVIQPVLGRVADTNSYAQSFIAGGVIQVIAIPFLWLVRREKHDTDKTL